MTLWITVETRTTKRRERKKAWLDKMTFTQRLLFEIKTAFVVRVPSTLIYGPLWLFSPDYRQIVRERRFRRKRPNSFRLPARRVLRRRLLARDGPGCRMCHRTNRPLTIDHVIQISDGGSDTLDNMQLLCRPCHDIKDDMVPVENYI